MSGCYVNLTFFYFGTNYDWHAANVKILSFMSTIKIKPLGERVLIQPLKAEEKTAGGIIIPDTAKEKPQKGIVKAISAEVKEKKSVAVGDTVLYGKFAGTEITSVDMQYLIMEESEILAII